MTPRTGVTAQVDYHALTSARWGDFERLMGARGACARYWCMWWRMTGTKFMRSSNQAKRQAMEALVASGATPGILAYLDGEPVGWCSVAPRETFAGLERSRALKRVDARPVWSITCFFVARRHRRRGLMRGLLEAAVRHAAAHGATIIEGYPVEQRDSDMPAADGYTGFVPVFEAAGFVQVAPGSPKRRVMRLAVGSDPGARSVLTAYCAAWNRWDLDALFALFAEDAVYRGTHRVLMGPGEIRRMYETSREKGLTDSLVAGVVPLKSGTWGVALWRQAGSDLRSLVAMKHFVVRDGRILQHDLTEGASALAELAEGAGPG